ncbi:MAG: ATP-binding protein [Bacteroidales bacterium]|nr:ATP-binding protein [Bacteroidales bacterium]
MENPFVFGKAVEGIYFTDRVEDAKRLSANLTHGINTILISPRRLGKTSLVKKVIAECNDNGVVMVFCDVFACKSEYDFYKAFATAIIKQTSSKIEEWVSAAKLFLSRISPKFSFGSDPMNDFSLSFDWNSQVDSAEEILNLPERIAQQKGIRMVVCLDEFQQVAEIPESLTFQKRLRSVWQHQQNVTYCMFGSKKHMMVHLFDNPSSPFYKFADMMFVKRIPAEEWIPYICQHFRETGKSISPELALRICEVTENISSYVQHLSWIVWYMTESQVSNQIVNRAIDGLLEQNRAFLQRDIEQLTELQLNFLKAVANGVTKGFTRKEVLHKYRLESSANVQAIKKSLVAKDIVDITDDGIMFNDSMLKLWITRNVMV